MEEIKLEDLFNYFKKNVIIIILVTLLFGMIGFLYTNYIQIPVYNSQTTLLLLQATTTEGSITQSDIQLNQKLITTYSEIIKSNKVLNRVINELNLDTTIKDLSDAISVSSKSDSIIITITVTDEKPEMSMKMANSVAKVFMEEIGSLMSMENVSLIDEATLPINPANVKANQQIIIALGAGFILSAMILFIIFYFDTTIKSEEQIENIVDLPVIGSVPKNKKRRGL